MKSIIQCSFSYHHIYIWFIIDSVNMMHNLNSSIILTASNFNTSSDHFIQNTTNFDNLTVDIVRENETGNEIYIYKICILISLNITIDFYHFYILFRSTRYYVLYKSRHWRMGFPTIFCNNGNNRRVRNIKQLMCYCILHKK